MKKNEDENINIKYIKSPPRKNGWSTVKTFRVSAEMLPDFTCKK